MRRLGGGQGVDRYGDRLGRVLDFIGHRCIRAVPRYLVADQFLDLVEVVGLLGSEQRIGDAGQPGAPRSTDAVDVILGVVRHVVVDDVADAGHVEPARGNVGGDEDDDRPRFEAVELADAVGLLHVAVDLPGAQPGLLEHVGELADILLAVAEDDRVLDLGVGEQLAQGGTLAADRRLDDKLGDRRVGRGGPRDLDLLGVRHEAVGKFLDRPGHRR